MFSQLFTGAVAPRMFNYQPRIPTRMSQNSWKVVFGLYSDTASNWITISTRCHKPHISICSRLLHPLEEIVYPRWTCMWPSIALISQSIVLKNQSGRKTKSFSSINQHYFWVCECIYRLFYRTPRKNHRVCSNGWTMCGSCFRMDQRPFRRKNSNGKASGRSYVKSGWRCVTSSERSRLYIGLHPPLSLVGAELRSTTGILEAEDHDHTPNQAFPV